MNVQCVCVCRVEQVLGLGLVTKARVNNSADKKPSYR